MAFGRENPQDTERADAWRDWLQRQHPFAIASFVLGVISIIEFGVLLVFGIAGIVMGVLALAQIRKPRKGPDGETPAHREGHRLAWAGIILSALSLLLAGVIYSLPPAGATPDDASSALVRNDPPEMRRT